MIEEGDANQQKKLLSAADIRQFDPLATPSPKRVSKRRPSFEVTIEPLTNITTPLFQSPSNNSNREEINVIKNGRFSIHHYSKDNNKENMQCDNSPKDNNSNEKNNKVKRRFSIDVIHNPGQDSNDKHLKDIDSQSILLIEPPKPKQDINDLIILC